jgi:Ca-activated chloride channel homolog
MHADIEDLSCRVTLMQKFSNTTLYMMDITYTYRLPLSAAVSSFHAVIEDRTVKSVLQEKNKALNTYDDAIAEGHGAYLAEKNQDNNFSCKIGSLEAKTEVSLYITFVMTLSYDNRDIIFSLPALVDDATVSKKFS